MVRIAIGNRLLSPSLLCALTLHCGEAGKEGRYQYEDPQLPSAWPSRLRTCQYQKESRTIQCKTAIAQRCWPTLGIRRSCCNRKDLKIAEAYIDVAILGCGNSLSCSDFHSLIDARESTARVAGSGCCRPESCPPRHRPAVREEDRHPDQAFLRSVRSTHSTNSKWSSLRSIFLGGYGLFKALDRRWPGRRPQPLPVLSG